MQYSMLFDGRFFVVATSSGSASIGSRQMNMIILAAQATPIHYLPIATTLIAIVFCSSLVQRYRDKGEGVHLLWWAAGVATYGMGTGLESVITIAGNSAWLNKWWYVMGALLGAYPLAQGTVYLLLPRQTANLLTMITLPMVFLLAVLVALCPVNLEVLDPFRPSGRVLVWSWLRWFTPLINCYAAIFLVGGAVLSSWRFAKNRATRQLAVGNALIAIGAMMPGFGGMAAKVGSIETLYVTELIGLMVIWVGYSLCVRSSNDGKAKQPNRMMERLIGGIAIVTALLVTVELIRQSIGVGPIHFPDTENPIVTGKNWHIFYTPLGMFLVWLWVKIKRGD
jgi:hypothetical protein